MTNTATPYKLFQVDGQLEILSANQEIIATVAQWTKEDKEECEANADFIVNACNEYEGLKENLKQAYQVSMQGQLELQHRADEIAMLNTKNADLVKALTAIHSHLANKDNCLALCEELARASLEKNCHV